MSSHHRNAPATSIRLPGIFFARSLRVYVCVCLSRAPPQAQPLRRPRGTRDPQQQQREGGKAGATRKRKVSAEIFEKYGWNKMESHFPVL